MRTGTLFLGLCTIFFSLLLVSAGLCLALMPWLPTLQALLLQLTEASPMSSFFAGFSLVLLGFSLLSLAVYLHRQRPLVLRMGPRSIEVNTQVINRYVAHYWKQVFPEQPVTTAVTLKGRELHIDAELPDTPLENQRRILQRAEHDLIELFAKVLDYHKDFVLSVHFGTAGRPAES